MSDVHEQSQPSAALQPDPEKDTVLTEGGQTGPVPGDNTEGTFHQAQLSFKPTRKHFFSPLDPSYADAVHRDAATVQFTPEEEVFLWFLTSSIFRVSDRFLVLPEKGSSQD